MYCHGDRFRHSFRHFQTTRFFKILFGFLFEFLFVETFLEVV